ncbi:MAG: alpha/beta fold hydrolase [Flavobacteriaceae bacterium]
MPVISPSYKPPVVFQNGHFSTIYSSKLRIPPRVKQIRERLTLTDGDFMDLDWSYSKKPSNKLIVLLHGLEGNAQRTYIIGAASHSNKKGWDTVAVNFRGCSGEPNRLFRSYTAGTTGDLEEVINHILEKDCYDKIVLNGFSLGGNLMLKYLGEQKSIPKEIKKGVAVSTPLSLEKSLNELNKRHNFIYSTYFLIGLKKSYKEKAKLFPDQASREDLKKIKSLLDFDNVYTSKAHGFDDAYDYYEKNSSLPFLPKIKIPVLLLQAQNDSFLSPLCFPDELAKIQNNIFLEMPKYGGHVGFYNKNNVYYNEQRAIEFAENI